MHSFCRTWLPFLFGLIEFCDFFEFAFGIFIIRMIVRMIFLGFCAKGMFDFFKWCCLGYPQDIIICLTQFYPLISSSLLWLGPSSLKQKSRTEDRNPPSAWYICLLFDFFKVGIYHFVIVFFIVVRRLFGTVGTGGSGFSLLFIHGLTHLHGHLH